MAKEKMYVKVVNEYDRYGNGGMTMKRVKASSLYDVLEPHFGSWAMDEGDENPSKRRQRELVHEWETSNGDGCDLVLVMDVTTGKVVFGDDVLAERG